MAQAMVNFRMDDELKRKMEQTCKDMGISMTAAFTMFATKVTRERRIPFDVTADSDPFYSPENIARLKQSILQMEETGGTIHEVDYND